MESTRRLSLTLLLVTPIIAARRLSAEDLGLTGAAVWSGLSEPQTEPQDEWSGATEPTGASSPPEVYGDGVYGDFGAWLRRKRALDAPGDDLETAEQVLFRPTFRYKHLVKEREQRHKLREELRRQFTQNSPVPASSSTSVASLPSTSATQRKYYSTYAQQNPGVYTSQVPTAQRVYAPQVALAQKNSPQVAPAQKVYSPQVAAAQRVYSPNYQGLVGNPSQYPRTQLFTQNNQGFRPQRSPYAYFYSQRFN